MTEQQNIPENKKEDKTDNKKEDENDLVDFTATLKRKKKKKKAHKITPAKQENADDKQDARKEYTYLEVGHFQI
ncbi:hypothetical protein MHBO_004743 [Bonamia ostreae]|uniref:Uncharacterized protein n=1 Tax=Bonamia ostreae TaxID=126728 RepID=A0ABV2AU51_9EUKA